MHTPQSIVDGPSSMAAPLSGRSIQNHDEAWQRSLRDLAMYETKQHAILSHAIAQSSLVT